jgi:transcriptional regulator with XRE-family HTH domain
MNKRIKRIRKELGLSQIEFAQLLGASQSNISKYERDELRPTCDFLLGLNKKLNININWLLTGSGNMFVNNPEYEIDTKSILKAVEIISQAIKKNEP